MFSSPIRLMGLESGEILTKLKDSAVIECSYPLELGIYETYKVKSWTANVGNRTFSGDGDVISHELTKYINETKNLFLHLTVILNENKTGHLSSEGVYIIRMNQK